MRQTEKKCRWYTPKEKDIFHFLIEAEPDNMAHHIGLVGDNVLR